MSLVKKNFLSFIEFKKIIIKKKIIFLSIALIKNRKNFIPISDEFEEDFEKTVAPIDLPDLDEVKKENNQLFGEENSSCCLDIISFSDEDEEEEEEEEKEYCEETKNEEYLKIIKTKKLIDNITSTGLEDENQLNKKFQCDEGSTANIDYSINSLSSGKCKDIEIISENPLINENLKKFNSKEIFNAQDRLKTQEYFEDLVNVMSTVPQSLEMQIAQSE